MIKLILKGALLWLTALSIIIFISGGGESLIENHQYLLAWVWLLINIVCVIVSRHILTDRDFYRLSLLQWANKQLTHL